MSIEAIRAELRTVRNSGGYDKNFPDTLGMHLRELCAGALVLGRMEWEISKWAPDRPDLNTAAKIALGGWYRQKQGTGPVEQVAAYLRVDEAQAERLMAEAEAEMAEHIDGVLRMRRDQAARWDTRPWTTLAVSTDVLDARPHADVPPPAGTPEPAVIFISEADADLLARSTVRAHFAAMDRTVPELVHLAPSPTRGLIGRWRVNLCDPADNQHVYVRLPAHRLRPQETVPAEIYLPPLTVDA